MSEAREVWGELVAQWRSSGQTAREFASRHGVNPSTLYGWASRLGREEGSSRLPRADTSMTRVPRMIELRAHPVEEDRFEIEVGGRRVRVPPSFDVEALRRLLAVLEESP